MTAAWLVAVPALGILLVESRRAGAAYLKFRGKRVVRCPETEQPAAVAVAAGRAAATAFFKRPALRLRECSRWRGRPACGQQCLRQIEAAPEDCLVRTLITAWCRGKSCFCCGRPLGEIHWKLHKPCLISPELRIVEWKDIPPEALPRVLETHRPVCWACNVAETHIW